MLNTDLSFKENLDNLENSKYKHLKKIATKFVETSKIDDKYNLLFNSDHFADIFIISALIINTKYESNKQKISYIKNDELFLSQLFQSLGEKEYQIKNWGLDKIFYLNLQEISAVKDTIALMNKNRYRFQIIRQKSFKDNFCNFKDSIFEEAATNLVERGEILEKHQELLKDTKKRETFFLVSMLLFNSIVDDDKSISRYFITGAPYVSYKLSSFDHEYQIELIKNGKANYDIIKNKYHIDKIEELFSSIDVNDKIKFVMNERDKMISYLGLNRLCSIKNALKIAFKK